MSLEPTGRLGRVALRRVLTLLGQVLTLHLAYGAAMPDDRPGAPVFLTQESFVEGLRTDLDLNDPRAVFRFVFSRLNPEITAYPTENYYYFDVFVAGRRIQGNLGLFADGRDDGQLNFAYYEVTNVHDAGTIDRAITLTAAHGIHLTKITDFKYSITFEGRTVVVNLNQVGVAPPRNAKLLGAETYVGTTCDESGLRFHLIYNETGSHLYWILDEDEAVPERFVNYGDDIVVGKRTEFAFFVDGENRRKVLIGVKKDNIERNTWYDGPFDQLPDNYIANDQVAIQKYLEASFPESKGAIDKFGNFLSRRGERVAVASYLVYSKPSELTKRLKKYRKHRGTPRFYCDITTETPY